MSVQRATFVREIFGIVGEEQSFGGNGRRGQLPIAVSLFRLQKGVLARRKSVDLIQTNLIMLTGILALRHCEGSQGSAWEVGVVVMDVKLSR